MTKVYGFAEEASCKDILTDEQMRDIVLNSLGREDKGARVAPSLRVELGPRNWGRSVQELALKSFSSRMFLNTLRCLSYIYSRFYDDEHIFRSAPVPS